jgi:hypothetical protein
MRWARRADILSRGLSRVGTSSNEKLPGMQLTMTAAAIFVGLH